MIMLQLLIIFIHNYLSSNFYFPFLTHYKIANNNRQQTTTDSKQQQHGHPNAKLTYAQLCSQQSQLHSSVKVQLIRLKTLRQKQKLSKQISGIDKYINGSVAGIKKQEKRIKLTSKSAFIQKVTSIKDYNKIYMQQTSNYIQLANEIHNLAAYNQLYELMSNFQVLQRIFLYECEKSEKLLFVACQMLSKKLLSRELLNSSDDIDGTYDTQTFDLKKLTLFKIASKLHEIIGMAADKMQQYLIRSCLNAISMCMHISISNNSNFDPIFTNYLKLLAPDFIVNEALIKPSDSYIAFVEPSKTILTVHHKYCIEILTSLLDYVTNSTYSENYYHFRRSLYSFRNHYLMYYLNYGIFCLKSVFQTAMSNFGGSALTVCQSIRPALKLFENIVMYPFSLNMHQFQIEDEIHENISGLQTEIYFPSYFRSLLCDTGFLMDIIGYYSQINAEAATFQIVREDIYALIRLIGRILSTSEYVFVGGEQQKKAFRALSSQFVTRILKQNKFFDSYLIICITKINIKFMSVQNEDQMFLGKKTYFDALMKFILKGLNQCQGKIEDGDKHPFRQLFQMLTAFVNITANTSLDIESKNCAQEALNILFKVRLVNNDENTRLMREFGFNNGQEIDCFAQIFGRVPQIFKINLPVNLTILHELNLTALNGQSLTFWLHLTSLLLPQHDTSIQQTQLIIKFLSAAIDARSIASLHFIQTLMQEILYEIKDGVSTTYLWKFIEQTKNVKFQQFLSYIIEYAMKILTVPNYALIQNCLSLFKAMFTKLCRNRHKSFIQYFEIIEQVCKEIDKTMLVRPDFMKLRIGFFSIISIIWVNQGQIGFVYRIFTNIRQSLGQHSDFVHLLRYLTDITGLLEPVESSQVYKLLMELVIVDMKFILPFYFGSPQRLKAAFSDQLFLKTFIKFIYTVINDNGFRMTLDSHTQLPFQIQEMFRPYLIEALKYDYPQRMVETWLKFIKLNPLGKLLPLDKSLKQKNSPMYKSLIRQYFQNLHRLNSLEQFYYMYQFIDDNIDLLVDWWQEIMIRDYKPQVNVGLIVNAHIWVNLRQKEHFAKLLYRIARYDSNYWRIQCDANTEAKYAEWFVANYK